MHDFCSWESEDAQCLKFAPMYWTHVSKVHWNSWCHYLEFNASAQKIMFPFLSIAILEPSELFYTLKRRKFEKLHQRPTCDTFLSSKSIQMRRLQEERTIWVHMGHKSPLAVTWFQAQLSEENKQKEPSYIPAIATGYPFYKVNLSTVHNFKKTFKNTPKSEYQRCISPAACLAWFQVPFSTPSWTLREWWEPLWLRLSRVFYTCFTEE